MRWQRDRTSGGRWKGAEIRVRRKEATDGNCGGRLGRLALAKALYPLVSEVENTGNKGAVDWDVVI